MKREWLEFAQENYKDYSPMMYAQQHFRPEKKSGDLQSKSSENPSF